MVAVLYPRAVDSHALFAPVTLLPPCRPATWLWGCHGYSCWQRMCWWWCVPLRWTPWTTVAWPRCPALRSPAPTCGRYLRGCLLGFPSARADSTAAALFCRPKWVLCDCVALKMKPVDADVVTFGRGNWCVCVVCLLACCVATGF
jgi:hypothetical protein